MIYSNDDLDRALAAYEKAQQEWEDSLPHCDCCGEPIDDYVWEIDDEILCEDCAIEKYRRSVD